MPAMKSSPKDTCHPPGKRVAQPHKDALLKRLKRVEGQVRGVAKMIEEDRYCPDILTQVSAARSALDAVAMQLLQDHTRGCVRDALKSGGGEEAIGELMTVLAKLIR